jgi:acetyl-CoA carboxylase/biotin carboxylase 1
VLFRSGSGGGSSAGAAGGGGGGGGVRAFPWVYTFRSSLGYAEDSIVRHMQPPSSAALELHRLSSFSIRLVHTPNRAVHVYAAQPKEETGKKKSAGGGGDAEGGGGRGVARMRFFVRCVVRQAARIPTLDSVYEQYPGPERMFVECLDALSVAMGDGALKDTTLPVGNNHIFLNLSPVVTSVRPEYIEAVIKILARRYADRLRRLRVSQVEFRIVVQQIGNLACSEQSCGPWLHGGAGA